MSNNLATELQNKKYARWRIQIFGITWLAYAGYYFTRKAFSVAKVGITNDPGITLSDQALGNIDAAYLIAYAIGQFTWGMLADKVGTRKVVLGGLFFSVFAAVAMGLSSTAVLFGLFIFIQGLCQSTGWAPLSKNMANWFATKERGKVFGFWCTNYAFGGLAASPFAGYMATKVFEDWRGAFFGPAIFVGFIWVLFILLQRNKPEDLGLPPIEEYKDEDVAVLDEGEAPEEEPEGSWKVIWEVLSNKVILTLGLVYFLQKPARYAIILWGPIFIMRRLNNTNMLETGAISMAFDLAGLFSAIVAGFASDYFFKSRRMPVCVISLILLSIALCLFDPLTVSEKFSGDAQFKFSIIDKKGETTYWSNDGTGENGDQPKGSIPFTVTKGKVNVTMGSNGMQALDTKIYNDNKSLKIRVWYDGGNGEFIQIPDRKLNKYQIKNLSPDFIIQIYTKTASPLVMIAILFAIGFFLYGPDSIVSGTAAVDFGTRKGASTAAGFINGCGSIGAVLGGFLPGYVENEAILFYGFGAMTFLSALILIPFWNKMPAVHKEE